MTAAPRGRRTPLGRIYLAAVTLAGAACVTLAARDVVLNQPSPNWLVFAALTWAAGWFAIKVPAIPATIYVSETFVFALVLLFGAGPAVVTVVIDGALISLRRRDTDVGRCLFNMAEPALSVTAAVTVFRGLAATAPFALSAAAPPDLAVLLLPVVGMAAVYYLVNSWLTAVAVASDTGMAAYRVWRKHFLGLALNTLGGALLGLLLGVQAPALGGTRYLGDLRLLSGMGIVVPLLLISYLTFRNSVARVEDANRHLTEMNHLYLSTVETLATAIDAKDQVTSHHIRRVQHYALNLARAVGVNEDPELKAIEVAALLHDTGKLSVPEFILNKPGKLTAAEFERIKVHAAVGAHIVSQIDFPYPVVPIIRHHHENWDGTGYPDGLAGEAIPLGARIMAVVDCYDALTSHRPYRTALSSDDALEIIRARRGSGYDPRIVDAFLQVVREIAPTDVKAPDPASAPPWLALQATTVDSLQRVPAEERAASGETRPNPEALLLLCSLADGLMGRATLDDLAEAMSRHLRRLVPAPLVVFYLPDDGGSLVARHASGVGDGRVDGVRIPLGAGLSGWVAVNRATISNSDPALDLGNRLVALCPPLESALSVPLVWRGELVGVLTLYAATRDAFSEDHRLLVDIAARQIAPAVAEAVRFDEHRATELRDGATGLPNRRSFDHLITSTGFAQAAPSLSLGVLCLAIDRHGSGGLAPQLLLRVADATRQAVRATDLVFRYSDDELVVLMPDTSASIAGLVAGRVAARVLDDVTWAADLPMQVGIAFAPQDGLSIGDLLLVARHRLEGQRWRELVTASSGRADVGEAPA